MYSAPFSFIMIISILYSKVHVARLACKSKKAVNLLLVINYI